jgi:Tol biopolymer transport system component
MHSNPALVDFTLVVGRQCQRLCWLLAGIAALSLTACQTCPCTQGHVQGARAETMMFGQLPGFAVDAPSSASNTSHAKAAHLSTTSTPEASLTQVSFAMEGADFDPEVDPSGTWIVYASTQHDARADIYRKQIDGRTQVQLTRDDADDVMPAISPDGRNIVFASNRSGNWDIWMMSINGGAATQLTSEADHELHPGFSPDGRHVAYCRQNDYSGRWEIWTFDITRPGARSYVCDGLFPQWSPEPGRNTLLFQRPRERGSRLFGIWTIDVDDGRGASPTEILSSSEAAIMHPSWSPDGRSICFCSVSLPPAGSALWPEQANIWLVKVDGTQRVSLTTSRFRNTQPTWSGDGRIYFVSDRGGADSLWSIQADEPGKFSRGTLASFEETEEDN